MKKLATFVLGISTFLFSCVGGNTGQNPVIPGLDGPHVSVSNTHLLVSTVFKDLRLNGGLRYPLPKLRDSYVELSPDLQSNGVLLAFSFSLEDILGRDLDDMQMMGLPGGRPIPEIPGGRMPGIAFTVQHFTNMVFYLSDDKMALYFPWNNTIPDMGFDYFVGDKKMGRFFFVSPDIFAKNAGYLLILDINKRTKRRLKRLLR